MDWRSSLVECARVGARVMVAFSANADTAASVASVCTLLRARGFYVNVQTQDQPRDHRMATAMFMRMPGAAVVVVEPGAALPAIAESPSKLVVACTFGAAGHLTPRERKFFDHVLMAEEVARDTSVEAARALQRLPLQEQLASPLCVRDLNRITRGVVNHSHRSRGKGFEELAAGFCGLLRSGALCPPALDAPRQGCLLHAIDALRLSAPGAPPSERGGSREKAPVDAVLFGAAWTGGKAPRLHAELSRILRDTGSLECEMEGLALG